MKFERFNDPTEVDEDQVAALLANGDVPIIQFSEPPARLAILSEIDALCRKFGDRLEVRFYGFYGQSFDAGLLASLPHVQWLSVDCLERAESLEPLSQLSHLGKLSFGVFRLDAPDILSRINLGQIKELRLGETAKNNIDLTPLAHCAQLSRLTLSSHTKGINSLGKLSGLTELTLRSIPNKQSLAFVGQISGLKKLSVMLGGRSDLNEISHPELTELEVVWVRGFEDTGDFGRFPSLEWLRIENQLRLTAIDFDGGSPRLKKLGLFNCKKLTRLGKLSKLTALEELRVAVTALDFETLVAAGLPSSLRHIGFWTGKTKSTDLIHKRLVELGYPNPNE